MSACQDTTEAGGKAPEKQLLRAPGTDIVFHQRGRKTCDWTQSIEESPLQGTTSRKAKNVLDLLSEEQARRPGHGHRASVSNIQESLSRSTLARALRAAVQSGGAESPPAGAPSG